MQGGISRQLCETAYVALPIRDLRVASGWQPAIISHYLQVMVVSSILFYTSFM